MTVEHLLVLGCARQEDCSLDSEQANEIMIH